MSDLSVGVGRSIAEDSFLAGKEAASMALRQHNGNPGQHNGNPGQHNGNPDVLFVFGSPRFDHRQLLAGIISVMGNLPMVGGSTAGEISTSGFSSLSVVIMALSSNTLKFTTGIGKKMSRDERVCGIALINDIREKTEVNKPLSLFVFPNGMGGDGVKVIRGIQSVLGNNIEIVGGFLGDDVKFENTFQFYNGKVYRDAISGLLIHGRGNFVTGIGVRSGFESIGNLLYCTQSEGNIVKQFDGERALDLYKEFLGPERSARLPEICLEYPFGLIDNKVSIAGKDFFQLRCGLSVNDKKGTITLAGSIPEGSAITLTTASRGDIISGARLAAEQAKNCLGDAVPEAVMMFSCVGRKIVLGRRTSEEVEAVRNVLGENVPIIGFYTYGEIGPIDKMRDELSITKFHNETVVLWILGSY